MKFFQRFFCFSFFRFGRGPRPKLQPSNGSGGLTLREENAVLMRMVRDLREKLSVARDAAGRFRRAAHEKLSQVDFLKAELRRRERDVIRLEKVVAGMRGKDELGIMNYEKGKSGNGFCGECGTFHPVPKCRAEWLRLRCFCPWEVWEERRGKVELGMMNDEEGKVNGHANGNGGCHD